MAHHPPCPRDASLQAIAVRHGFGLADGGRHLRAAQVMRVTTASEGSSRARARREEDQRTAQLYNVGDQKFLVLEGPMLSRRAGRIVPRTRTLRTTRTGCP